MNQGGELTPVSLLGQRRALMGAPCRRQCLVDDIQLGRHFLKRLLAGRVGLDRAGAKRPKIPLRSTIGMQLRRCGTQQRAFQASNHALVAHSDRLKLAGRIKGNFEHTSNPLTSHVALQNLRGELDSPSVYIPRKHNLGAATIDLQVLVCGYRKRHRNTLPAPLAPTRQLAFGSSEQVWARSMSSLRATENIAKSVD